MSAPNFGRPTQNSTAAGSTTNPSSDYLEYDMVDDVITPNPDLNNLEDKDQNQDMHKEEENNQGQDQGHNNNSNHSNHTRKHTHKNRSNKNI
ncbi:unnamed protein product [Sordaria macrospora k-hell]|uniref:WGS project CABT00000000 data, contig 2.21 n=1 Tax=Sordaria macrospora (strain ATCC MYA-333 / DSM 997 / K(L3346) / K-hell) TaxID=771870 RepID=F7W271_SORMK|nr:uncharacterized protein SMAC_04703 [Sordaria macrospora k-hell]KAH7630910.1 hypothetical protein B0T09DRAFT_408596 [Sordaria sp. MPI-SDFR-AT-0083]CCC11721.1 unnamed protein product [Sordaria macrospora k-hell]